MWSPSHAGSFGTGRDNGFASSLGNATADMHAFCSKGRITHPLCIGAKIVRFNFGDGARSIRFCREGWELLDHLDKLLNLAMREQFIGLFGPGGPFSRGWSVNGIRHFPDMFSGMVEIDNMHRMGEVVLSHPSNPAGPIPIGIKLRASLTPPRVTEDGKGV